jgi:hypothetical protein
MALYASLQLNVYVPLTNVLVVEQVSGDLQFPVDEGFYV